MVEIFVIGAPACSGLQELLTAGSTDSQDTSVNPGCPDANMSDTHGHTRAHAALLFGTHARNAVFQGVGFQSCESPCNSRKA